MNEAEARKEAAERFPNYLAMLELLKQQAPGGITLRSIVETCKRLYPDLDVSEGYISKVLRGIYVPADDRINAGVAHALGATPIELDTLLVTASVPRLPPSITRHLAACVYLLGSIEEETRANPAANIKVTVNRSFPDTEDSVITVGETWALQDLVDNLKNRLAFLAGLVRLGEEVDWLTVMIRAGSAVHKTPIAAEPTATHHIRALADAYGISADVIQQLLEVVSREVQSRASKEEGGDQTQVPPASGHTPAPVRSFEIDAPQEGGKRVEKGPGSEPGTAPADAGPGAAAAPAGKKPRL